MCLLYASAADGARLLGGSLREGVNSPLIFRRGAIGAWIKNVQAAEQGEQGESAILEDGDGPDGSGNARPEEGIEKEK
jgi:hypothetical protein